MKLFKSILATAILACAATGAGAETVKVTLILPFQSNTETPSANYMDFYAGALLAADAMSRAGVSISLNVMDFSEISLQENSEPAKKISSSDLVIGPVTVSQQSRIQAVCRDCEIPFVSPLDPATESFTSENPYFFQIPASQDRQIANLIRRVAEDENGGVVTLFSNPVNPREIVLEKKYSDALDAAGIEYDKITYDVLNGRDIIDSLKARMYPDSSFVHQRVVIASEDEAFASDVIRNMNLVKIAGLPVSVYGSYRITTFETIDVSALYKLHFRTSTPYWVDYSSESTRDFILKYRALYNTEPTAYAYQGYDILSYFVSTISDLGENFTDFVEYYPMDMLQNSIRFHKCTNEEGGYVNIHTRDIEYRPNNTIAVIAD